MVKYIIMLLPSLAFAQQLDPVFMYAARGPQGTPPITFQALGTNTTTTAATDYATLASCAPSSNSLILCVTVSSLAAWARPTNISGCSVTWSNITSTNYNGSAMGISIWRAMTNATPPAGTVTAKYAASQTGGGLYVCQFKNVDTSGSFGSGAIVQVVKGTNATANCNVSLSALTGTANAVFAYFGNVDSNGSFGSPEAGWTTDLDEGYNTPATGQYGTHRLATTDNTVVVTSSAQQWAGIAIEIKQKP